MFLHGCHCQSHTRGNDQMITRAELRGKPLDSDCYRANKSLHESGFNDDRVFCYGLYKDMADEIKDKCKECKAFAGNAEPYKGE